MEQLSKFALVRRAAQRMRSMNPVNKDVPQGTQCKWAIQDVKDEDAPHTGLAPSVKPENVDWNG